MGRPSLLGLIVAAIIGGTAAISWSLSTWIAFDNAAPASGQLPAVASSAGDGGTFAARLPVEALPETVGHDD